MLLIKTICQILSKTVQKTLFLTKFEAMRYCLKTQKAAKRGTITGTIYSFSNSCCLKVSTSVQWKRETNVKCTDEYARPNWWAYLPNCWRMKCHCYLWVHPKLRVDPCTPFFYQISFNKNRQAQNWPKFKNLVRIIPKFTICNFSVKN